MRCIFLFLLSFAANQSFGQAFIFNQFFQPSVRLNTEYTPDMGTRLLGSSSDALSYGRANFNLILPIKSKLGVKVDWLEALKAARNIRSFKLKDVGKIARIKMYQIFWNVRPQVFFLQYSPSDSAQSAYFPQKQQAFGLSTGITGIHTLRRFRLLFYSFNAGFVEDKTSVRQMQPNMTAVIGIAHINRVIYYWYYGAYLNYSNGRFIPAPFFGIEANLAKKLWLNITLPVQMRLGWQLSKMTKLDLVLGLNGYSSGFTFDQPINGGTDPQRGFYSGFQFRISATYNVKLGKQTKLFFEAGVIPARRFNILRSADNLYTPQLNPTVYGGFSIFYSFKKSLLGSVIDGLISF
jgi:hypothetical protein